MLCGGPWKPPPRDRAPRMKANRIPPWIEIAPSHIRGAGTGAFTRIELAQGRTLGEYRGRHLSPEQYRRHNGNPYIWEVRDEHDVPILYLDAARPRHANWTRYVNCPRSQAEENLEVRQEGMCVYYIAKRNIRAGEELLIWYGSDYGEWLLGKSSLE